MFVYIDCINVKQQVYFCYMYCNCMNLYSIKDAPWELVVDSLEHIVEHTASKAYTSW